jgi:hypothetical protein
MIPYLVALPVMTLVGRSSDRRFERRYQAAIPLTIGGISLVLLGTAVSSVFLSVTLWCLVASGVYSLWGPFLSLPNEFLGGFSAATGIAWDQLYREPRGVCRALSDGSDQQQDWKFSRRACLSRCREERNSRRRAELRWSSVRQRCQLLIQIKNCP